MAPKFNPVRDIPSLVGKVVIVTGGNRGMGFHIVQQLANHGAKVYLAARSETSAREAIASIEAANPKVKNQKNVIFLKLDLATLNGTKEAAERFLSMESSLDILINNAAILSHPFTLSPDGLEDCMAVNHFAPFVFTKILEPVLVATSKKAGADVRVITVSSEAQFRAPPGGKLLTLDEINDPLGSDGVIDQFTRYGRSKLANTLFARRLQEKYDQLSSPILSISLHPGLVATESALETLAAIPFVGLIIRFIGRLFGMSPLDGAVTALYAATAPEVRARAGEFAGRYLVPYGKIVVLDKNGDAGSEELAKKLWIASEQITGSILEK